MRRTTVLAMSAVAAVSVAGCQPTLSLTVAPAPPESTATIATNEVPADSAPVDEPIVVQAQDGRLVEVVVTERGGRTVPGELSEDRTTWTSSADLLEFGTRYRVEAQAVDSRGRPTTISQAFTTVTPDALLSASVSPAPGTTFGVGMPITVTFDQPVVDKVAVEEAMTVSTPEPIVGAWNWVSDTQAVYRPKRYWPGETPISVSLDLRGVEAAPGVYGVEDVEAEFATHDSVVLKADAQTLQLTVIQDGDVVRTIPVTMGMDGYETLSGTKVIMTQERTRIMDNATAGVSEDDPDHYRVEVDYAMRLTWHGEFLHASPWAAGAWGNSRISHGCTSMSMENAAWLFGITHIGDPVEITGTPLEQNPGNGITVWNVPWKTWVGYSATGAHSTAPTTT